MKKKEPAWKAELKSDLHMADLDDDPLWPVIEKHIVAAEQRGFQAGVNKTGDSVGKLRKQLKTARADAFREVADHLESIDPIEFALGTVDAVREALRMAVTAACERCKGSGIDPEHSSPAEGPSYHSMGEPEALEPCLACQFPDKP